MSNRMRRRPRTFPFPGRRRSPSPSQRGSLRGGAAEPMYSDNKPLFENSKKIMWEKRGCAHLEPLEVSGGQEVFSNVGVEHHAQSHVPSSATSVLKFKKSN